MADPILYEIWRVREQLIKHPGRLDGYLAYVQKRDRARRQGGRPPAGQKARRPRKRTSPEE